MNPYMNCWASLMNIAKTFKDNNPSLVDVVMDFDESVLETEYPAGKLAGIYQVDYTESGPLIYVQCAFPLSVDSTSDVTELKKMAGLMGKTVRNETKHKFYDYETGNPIGLMVARDNLAISPLMKTSNRQFIFVGQGFVLDRTATFQPS